MPNLRTSIGNDAGHALIQIDDDTDRYCNVS